MSHVIEFIKKHWIAFSIGAVLLFLYLRSGSSSGANTGVSQAYLDHEAQLAQAGQAAQIAQLQAQTQVATATLQANVANAQTAANVTGAQLKSQDTLAAISAQEHIQVNADTLSAGTTQAVSLLQAQVAEQQVAAQVRTTEINAKAYVDIASLPYTTVTPALINKVNATASNLSNFEQDISNSIPIKSQDNYWTSQFTYGGPQNIRNLVPAL